MCNKPNGLRQNTRPDIHGILSPNPQSNASQEAHKRAYKSAIRQQCDAHRVQAKRGGDGRGGTHANPTRHPVNHRFTRPVHKEGSIPYGEASHTVPFVEIFRHQLSGPSVSLAVSDALSLKPHVSLGTHVELSQWKPDAVKLYCCSSDVYSCLNLW